MHRVFLCLAAAAVTVTPASAQELAGGMSRVERPPPFIGPPVVPPHRGDGRRDHRRNGRDDGGFVYGYADYYPSDFDGNRSWDPDRWNDWWHERPERAFPRWVWRNQNCTEDRMWWSGAGWRCTP